MFLFLLFFLPLNLKAHGFQALKLRLETTSGGFIRLKVLYHNKEEEYREFSYLTKDSKRIQEIYKLLYKGAHFFLGDFATSLHEHRKEGIYFFFTPQETLPKKEANPKGIE